jgi:hypothetical protein
MNRDCTDHDVLTIGLGAGLGRPRNRTGPRPGHDR